MGMEESHGARFWEPVGTGGDAVSCLLCPNGCVIRNGQTGRCRVRLNENGSLVAAAYGCVSSIALDPIEKKPLAHFYPGSVILSAGSFGCNLRCRFCQNHEISQTGVPFGRSVGSAFVRYTPADLVGEAVHRIPNGNIGIAYTYNEPFTNWEFVFDTAFLARKEGLKNVLVTNGYVNPAPLAELAPFIDAMNIDLKAWNAPFYRDMCGGSLDAVKATIETVARDFPECHTEITTLVIPGLNSSREEISQMSAWLASLSPDIPLHLTRHHSAYLMNEIEPVAIAELRALADVARENLRMVHCGNI